MRPENCEAMANSGQVVYLKASLNLLWSRLKDCQKRPLLQTENPKQKIKDLLVERDPVYTRVADLVVDVSAESSKKMAVKIKEMLDKE